MTDAKRGAIREELAVRVRAPRAIVWQEAETIDLILAHTQMVVSSVLDDRRLRASVRARLQWGPFGWTLNGDASIVEAHDPDRIVFQVDLPGVAATQTGTLELSEVSDDETNLKLTSDFDLGRLGNGVRAVVDNEIEAFIRSIVDGIRGRAERHWQAQKRLQNRDAIADKQ